MCLRPSCSRPSATTMTRTANLTPPITTKPILKTTLLYTPHPHTFQPGQKKPSIPTPCKARRIQALARLGGLHGMAMRPWREGASRRCRCSPDRRPPFSSAHRQTALYGPDEGSRFACPSRVSPFERPLERGGRLEGAFCSALIRPMDPSGIGLADTVHSRIGGHSTAHDQVLVVCHPSCFSKFHFSMLNNIPNYHCPSRPLSDMLRAACVFRKHGHFPGRRLFVPNPAPWLQLGMANGKVRFLARKTMPSCLPSARVVIGLGL